MTGVWLASYIVLWAIVVVEGLVILALAREIETLHKHLDSLRTYLLSFEKDDKVDES